MDQSGLFKKKQQEQDNSASSEMAIRLRTLEDRYSNLQRRLQLNEENMIKSDRKINNDLRDMVSELTEVKHSVELLNNKVEMIVKELESFARRSDVEVLGKYINIWDPTRFVTQKEIDKIVEAAVEEKIAQHKDKKV